MDTRISRTLAFLEQTGFRSVSSAQLAERVGVSPSRLQHLFKDEVGCSIRAYVRKRRLWRAAVLLASTDLRISEVLWSVGFTDAANFTHAFKRAYGVTPRRFRERASGANPEVSRYDQQMTAHTKRIPLRRAAPGPTLIRSLEARPGDSEGGRYGGQEAGGKKGLEVGFKVGKN
jgi:AraC-like DNA-binding protein